MAGFLLVSFSLLSVSKLDSLVAVAEQQKGYQQMKSFFLLSQVKKSRDKEQAVEYAQRAIDLALKSDTDKYIAFAYTNALKLYFSLGDLDKATNYALLYLSVCEQMHDSAQVAQAYNNLGVLSKRKGDLFEALHYQKLALEIKNKRDNKKGQAVSLNNIGLIYQELGLTEKTIESYQQALRLKKELHDSLSVVNTLINLGNLYQELELDSLAHFVFRDALAYAEGISDYNVKSGLHRNYGSFLEKKGLYLKAEQHFQTSYSLNLKTNNVRGIVLSLINLGRVSTDMNKFDVAENYFEIAFEKNKELEEPSVLFNLNFDYAKLKMLQKAFKESERYYLKSKNIAHDNSFVPDFARTCLALSELYERQNKYIEAYSYFKRSHQISDSINTVNLQHKIANQFNLYRQEHELQKLNTARKIEQVKLQKSKLLNYSLLINFLVAIVLLAVMLFRYKKYKKQAEKLEQSEHLLKEQFELLSAIINTIPSPLYYKDTNDVYLGCNIEFEKFSGIKREQLIGKTIQEVLPNQSWNLHKKMDKEVLESGENLHYETTIISADNVEHQMMINKSVFYNQKGEKAGIIGVLIDVSDRKQLEYETNQREKFLRLINSANNTSHLSFDLMVKSALRGIAEAFNAEHTYCIRFKHENSKSWYGLYESSGGRFRFSEEIPGSLTDIYQFEGSTSNTSLIRFEGDFVNEAASMFPPRLRNAKNHFILPIYEEGKNVALFGLSMPESVVQWDQGHLSYFLYELWSVFARKENYERILAQEEELKEVNASKNKFFSIIAHDLKNPFHGMIGFASLLKEYYESLSDEERIDYINILFDSATSTYKLLENLLQWANTQTGKIQFNPDYVDLNSLYEEVLLILRTLAEKKDIEIKSNIPFNTIVYADAQMVLTILRNLLTNSIKFTHRNGLIEVSTSPKGKMIEVCVRDTGVGMPEDVANNLFKIDRKNKSHSGTEDEKGTGIGLFLTKEFVQKHGGEIWVESVPNEGSRFCFTIPSTREAIP